MSLDTAITHATVGAIPRATSSTPTAPDGRNATVIAAIRSHHARLAEQLQALTDAVLAAVPAGAYGPARDELLTWYRTELIPHAVAEEQALYGPAKDLDSTRLLVCGMLAEHRSLVTLIAELADASGVIEVAAAAAAARAVFTVHLSKENDLLLPALDIAGMDLGAALDGMHEILGHADPSQEQHGCGCGDCGCDDSSTQTHAAGTLPIAAAPTVRSDELDVRALPHGARHEIIFAVWRVAINRVG